MKLVNHHMHFQIFPMAIGNCVNAREVWQTLESRRDFSTWVKKRLYETQAEENEDYIKSRNSLLTQSGEQVNKGFSGNFGGYNKIDYFITLDLAKEFAMLERTKKGRDCRRYFIAVEKCFLANLLLHKDTAELLNLFNLKYQTPGANAILQEVRKLEHARNAKCSKVLEYAYKEYFKNGKIKIETEILLDYDRDIYLGKD